MEISDKLIVAIFAALGQKSRLAAFKLILMSGEHGLPAGDVARSLGVPVNTMSTHLSKLAQAQLLTSQRQGRHIIYSVNEEVWLPFVKALGDARFQMEESEDVSPVATESEDARKD